MFILQFRSKGIAFMENPINKNDVYLQKRVNSSISDFFLIQFKWHYWIIIVIKAAA